MNVIDGGTLGESMLNIIGVFCDLMCVSDVYCNLLSIDLYFPFSVTFLNVVNLGLEQIQTRKHLIEFSHACG